MDPKGPFLSFLNPYCMCGPILEVNIQCLLPILPAVSHRSNFVFSRMRPHSNWAHQNCLFLLLNKQNIALGPQPNLIVKIAGKMCYMLQNWRDHYNSECPVENINIRGVFSIFSILFQNLLIILFLWAWCVTRISPKTYSSQGQSQVIHWFIEWFIELVPEFVLITVIRGPNVIESIA